MSTRTIEVFLITGFLGSGKTTFLRHLLEQMISFPELKIGVLMNEYGSENVDKEVLPQEEIAFSEINGGSIFCSCLHSEFINALKLFYKSTEINTLLIETSGLSNPSMIFQDLNIVNNQIGDVYKIKESICLVDVSLIMKLMSAFTSITTQLEVSSIILVNKIDLANSTQVDSIERTIFGINPHSKISRVKFGQVNLKNLFRQEKMQIQRDFTEKRDVKGRLTTVTVTQSHSVSDKGFSAYMNSISDSLIRAKGYVHLERQGWFRIDQVGDNLRRIHVTSHPDQGSLVFIFKDAVDIQKIQSQWNILLSPSNGELLIG